MGKLGFCCSWECSSGSWTRHEQLTPMECPVCYNPYDTLEESHIPKVLVRCGHSLCVRCLRHLVEGPSMRDITTSNGRTGEPPAWNPPPYARITCPNCRQNMLVTEVRTNFALLAAVEQAASPQRDVALCSVHPRLACSHFCKQLGRFVCAECCGGSQAHCDAEHVAIDTIVDAVTDDVRNNLSGRCLLVKQQCSSTREELARRIEAYTANLTSIHQRIQSTAERLIHEIQCQVKDAERDLEMRHASVNSRTADVVTRLGIVERRAGEAFRRMEYTLDAVKDTDRQGNISGDGESQSLCPVVRDSVEWYCQHRRAILSLDPAEAIRCCSSNENGSELTAAEFDDAAVEEMLSAKCDALNLTPPRRGAGEQEHSPAWMVQHNASPSNRLLRLLRPPLDPPRVRLRYEGGTNGLGTYHIPHLFEVVEEPERLQSPPREQQDFSNTLRIGDLHLQ